MDTINALFTLGIPAAVIGTMAYRRMFPRTTERNNFAENITPQDIAQDTLLNTRQWMDYVNNNPDQVPHLSIIGGTGAGKSTCATAVLGDRRGQIVVITAKEGDGWGGLSYIGIDNNATYTTANNIFSQLDAEVKRRLVAVKNHTMTADWLTVVLDDYSTLRKVCDAADEPFKLIARLGRSLRVRLIVLSDSDQVKAWGIEGEGSTRQHFAFIRLQRGHKGTITIDDQDVPIDTSMIRELSLRANLSNRQWIIARDRNTELHDLLGINISGENTGNNTSIDTSMKGGIADIDAVSNDTDRAILAILRVNPDVSKNKIYDIVGGNRNTVLARIDELRQ